MPNARDRRVWPQLRRDQAKALPRLRLGPGGAGKGAEPRRPHLSSQAQQFRDAIGLTGVVMAKLDGTAKGDTLITLAEEVGLPVKLIGTGEKLEDL